MTQEITSDFFDLVVRKKMYSGKSNLKFNLDNLFEHVDLAQKNVLDVGGGRGLISFYAAVKGARNVVCLEPEQDGSRNGMIKGYNDLRAELPATLPVKLVSLTIQEYLQDIEPATYDVIIMHNSINHLDEDACIHLLDNDDSYNRYLTVLKSVYRIIKKKGVLIVTDCSCKNVFNDIGVKNILVPTIEWHKHQRPGTWASLLKKAGFKNPTIEWPTFNRLRKPGKYLMSNSFMAYLTSSYFKLTMEK